MILPIVAIGNPVLKQVAKDITPDYPELKQLIQDMFETMENAKGVGLAAPQIGKSIRLFIVDASPFADEEDENHEFLKDFRKVFINPKIVEENGEPWNFEEGCLSIPGIREEVERKEEISIEYYDENFKFHKEKFDDIVCRVIQHEYDHIEGILFTDHLNPLKKRLLKKKLANISIGDVKVNYKMKFNTKK